MHSFASRARSAGALLAFALAVGTAAPLGAQALRVPYTTFTLDNGLKVLVHEDHSLPIVTVNQWFRVGSGDEKPGRTGFAHLFEHMMFMGSEHVPTGDFDKLLEAAGADNNGSTTEDRTNYYENGPSNALPLMLWLDSDRMGYLLPELTAEKLDIQRGVVQNERRQSYENQPYGLSEENILKRLWPKEHPYHWPVIGSMTDLSAATLDDVKNFFRQYYAPNNAVLSIAGDVKAAEVKAQVTRWFGGIPRGPAITRPTAPPVNLTADVHGLLEDKVQLPRVYSAWHTQKAFGPDDAALQAAAQILAGGKSSRLYRRLVYEMQIATQVAAYHDAGRLDGKFVLFTTARPGNNLDALQRVVDAEVAKLAEQGPTEREMQRVKNSIEAEFLDAMQEIGGFGGKANQLNYYDYFVGTPDYFEKDLQRFQSLTPADIQRVAKQYLKAHRVVLSVVPEGKKELAVTEGRMP
jgi:zinc protease